MPEFIGNVNGRNQKDPRGVRLFLPLSSCRLGAKTVSFKRLLRLLNQG